MRALANIHRFQRGNAISTPALSTILRNLFHFGIPQAQSARVGGSRRHYGGHLVSARNRVAHLDSRISARRWRSCPDDQREALLLWPSRFLLRGGRRDLRMCGWHDREPGHRASHSLAEMLRT